MDPPQGYRKGRLLRDLRRKGSKNPPAKMRQRSDAKTWGSPGRATVREQSCSAPLVEERPLAHPQSLRLFGTELVLDELCTSATLPAGSVLLRPPGGSSFEALCEDLRIQGAAFFPSRATFEKLEEGIRTGASLDQEMVVVEGVPPIPPAPGRLQWLTPEHLPQDLVREQVPFLRIVPPTPAQDGTTVFGEKIPAPAGEAFPPIELQLPEAFYMNDEGDLCSKQSGQVKEAENSLAFEPVYKVADPTAVSLQEIDFPCPVAVTGELHGSMQWKIRGSFHVTGYWSATGIEVFGDVVADGGIQTNHDAPIRIHGDLKTTYIQQSKLGILGSVTVAKSIVQCEMRIGGRIQLTDSPGAIMGSTIAVFGSLKAERAGSDQGRATRITLYEDPLDLQTLSSSTQIGTLFRGTIMQRRRKKWVAAEDAPYGDVPAPAA